MGHDMVNFLDNPKQKIKVSILVIVLIILIWQLYQLFFADNISTLAGKKITANSPIVSEHLSNVSTPSATTSNASLPPNGVTNKVVAPSEPTFAGEGDVAQKKYLRLLQEYKILELQKAISADKQAIVVSELATTEAVNKLNSMGGQTQALNVLNDEGEDASDNTDTGSVNKSTKFNLQYTGLEDGEWVATLKLGETAYDVKIGTMIDGKYKVTHINNNAVILESSTQQITLSFDNEQIVDKSPAAPIISSVSTPPPVVEPPTGSAPLPPVSLPPQASVKAVAVIAPSKPLPAITSTKAMLTPQEKTEIGTKKLASQEAALMHPRTTKTQTSQPVQEQAMVEVPAQEVAEKHLASPANTQGKFLLQTEPTKASPASAPIPPVTVKKITISTQTLPTVLPAPKVAPAVVSSVNNNPYPTSMPMLETDETIVATQTLPKTPAKTSTPPVQVLAAEGPNGVVVSNPNPVVGSLPTSKTPPEKSTSRFFEGYWNKFKKWLSGDEESQTKDQNAK